MHYTAWACLAGWPCSTKPACLPACRPAHSHGVACYGPGPQGGQLGLRDEEAWVGGDGEGDGGVHLMTKGRGGPGRLVTRKVRYLDGRGS